ncbi:hypothetical protein [Mucilaginibacter sp. CSA2-8R]|uniref:hypothetical protein n=1 Tax=Mucilaginibacter sp. CSA2-8R TaxID=3141542 RepID=UPI00315CA22D
MKQEIITHLNNPGYLEKLYRSNEGLFKQEFGALYPELPHNDVAHCWHERLYHTAEDITWSNRRELIFVIVLAVVAGCIAKIPDFFNLDPEQFYPRNIGFVIFPLLAAYFSWKNGLSLAKISIVTTVMLVELVFINWLPNNRKSATFTLSCIHLLLALWSVLGFAFAGGKNNSEVKRLDYLKYNGELIIITTLFVIVGAITTAISINLFSLAGFQIKDQYLKNIPMFGLPTAIMIGTYLTQNNPQLVGKISPVIARLFAPLVLIVLIIYLAATATSKNSLYHDRDFLIIFNVLLIGVMALIFFSIAEHQSNLTSRIQLWVLLLLSIVTVIVNSMALSAIVFRISEWGLTPNRAAVMGGNILILINLILVSVQLTRTLLRKTETDIVSKSIALYLPVYFAWSIIVTFVFPFWFGFK